jgi:CDP-diacylglycerol pyrophosphatase
MFRVRGVTAFHFAAAAIALCAAAACALAAPQEIDSRDALWVVVHDECVPNELRNHVPLPCARVDLDDGIEKGFAILKDIRGGQQYLLIPTAPIAGIESPELLAPGAPNLFADAWDAQSYVDAALGQTLPRDDVGLAINSAGGRSQDQLHIHVDCVDPEVKAVLEARVASIGDHWTPLGIDFYGHPYWARWVAGERLGANNPIRLLADEIPAAAQDMGDRTLVVVGLTRADGTAGFVLLEDQVDRAHGDSAHGEELLDHACRVVQTAPQKN